VTVSLSGSLMQNLRAVMMSSVTRYFCTVLYSALVFIPSQVLWPCLHYAIPDAPKSKLFYESAAFKQYVAVNQRFADVIIENYEEGDISRSLSNFQIQSDAFPCSLGERLSFNAASLPPPRISQVSRPRSYWLFYARRLSLFGDLPLPLCP
jgi:hypothetical protein